MKITCPHCKKEIQNLTEKDLSDPDLNVVASMGTIVLVVALIFAFLLW